jgi:hypothetical protein
MTAVTRADRTHAGIDADLARDEDRLRSGCAQSSQQVSTMDITPTPQPLPPLRFAGCKICAVLPAAADAAA